MIETIKAITNTNGKQTELDVSREDFERAIFSLLTDPNSDLYRYCAKDERGNVYTHLRFRTEDNNYFFEFKIRKDVDQ